MLDFSFPVAPIARFFFHGFWCVGIINSFWKLPPPQKNNGSVP